MQRIGFILRIWGYLHHNICSTVVQATAGTVFCTQDLRHYYASFSHTRSLTRVQNTGSSLATCCILQPLSSRS